MWGQYDRALEYYEKSLLIAEDKGIQDLVPMLNNIAKIHETKHNYDKALKYYKKSLSNAKDIGGKIYYKKIILNIMRCYLTSGNMEQFFIYSDKYKALENQDVEIGSFLDFCNIVAKMEDILGEDEKAIKYSNTVLKLTKPEKSQGILGEYPRMRITALNQLGLTYCGLNKYDKAVPYFLQAIEILEVMRKTATGETRRDYLSSVLPVYSNLSSSYIAISDFQGVYNSIELSRAKLLAEQLAGSDSLVSIPDLAQVQSSLSSNQAIIIYANAGWDYCIELVITNDTIVGFEVPDSVMLSTLYPDNDDATLQLAIKSYRNSIKFFAGAEEITEFSKVFYDYLINPLIGHIQNKTELLIIPDGILGYLPFEVLIDKNGKYLIERYNITYAQSVSVWDLIRSRKYDEQQSTLLAVGGAVYNPQSYEVDMIENDKMLAYLERTVIDSISTRGSLRESYVSLGYSDWQNLPGSLEEINNISAIINNTDLISGYDATEKTIKELSYSGELSKYNMLHFATHGVIVSDIPELSAVVLTQSDDDLNGEDGYLTIGEIADLALKADFVNLSACETGLGKIYGGEGVVGLTQAFMLAGANSVSVSLWPIADEATSEFMLSVYTKIAEGLDYSDSIMNTKREFISGVYSEEYKHPFYWAPFVYYGP
tara:strand:- start:72 stop:2036 length:1965 start_codon:yes stop_codon:yes gene_type:complete